MVFALVVGTTGYAGAELVRLLSAHPKIRKLETVHGRSRAKREPFRGEIAIEGIRIPGKSLEKADVVFTATPGSAGIAGKLVPRLYPSTKLVDLSDELRPPKQSEAVYGLCEVYRDQIKKARIIANPGCYPTSVILALAPLVSLGLIDARSVSVFSQSGYTGASRTAEILGNPPLKGNSKIYCLADHRHIPEMESVLGLHGLNFTPVIMPFGSGMVSLISARKADSSMLIDLRGTYMRYYEEERFVELVDRIPHPSDARWTNKCLLHAVYDEHSGTIKIVSAIDNLGKGAAGQAVQNMNIMFGFDEGTGLETRGQKPF